MSAQTLGADLLGDVKVEGLDEVLQSLRTLEPPPRAPFGLPALDRLLEVFRSQSHRQPQINNPRSTLHRLTQQQGSTNTSKPPVIEITGAFPCSGKTQLLYEIIALSILPATHNGYYIHGKGAAVVVLDLDNRFSVLRFQQILSSYLHSLEVLPPEEDISFLLHNPLQHLHIFRPQSLGSLLATLDSLPIYLYDTHSHFSASRAVGALALDCVSAFLWQNRSDADGVSFSGGVEERGNDHAPAQTYQHLVNALRRVQHKLECTIIATNWGLARVQHVTGHPALRPHLPAAWTNFCTLRLVMERDMVSKFGPSMSAEEATREKLQRQEAVGRSGFSCWINWWGSDEWRDEVRNELNGMQKGGILRLRVEGGVMVFDGGQETLD